MKHQKLAKPFRKAAGKNKIPDYGAWLKHPLVPTLCLTRPLSCWVVTIFRFVLILLTQPRKNQDNSHCPVSYYEKDGLLRQMKPAYRELLTVWSTL